ncbi:hypothetical protein HYW58_00745 [Candidatus Kaiserbacteria bacterium]|nr:hypothetical protein [Candidatus Kaiserbacteria bacterium]
MEQDTEKLLRKNLELTEENNRLLRKMRRGAILGGIMKLVWLAVIIGVPVYLYIHFLAPILDQVVGAAQTVQEVGGKVENIQGQLQNQLGESGIQEILNLFKRQ